MALMYIEIPKAAGGLQRSVSNNEYIPARKSLPPVGRESVSKVGIVVAALTPHEPDLGID